MGTTKRTVEITITQEGTAMPKLLGGSDPVQILSMTTECTTPEQMEWVKDQFSAAMAYAAAEFRAELQTGTPADGPSESGTQDPEADPAGEEPPEDAPEDAPDEPDDPEACPPPRRKKAAR